MEQKTYKVMKIAGAGSIVIGIVVLTIGTAAGILSIINGACLLKQKSRIIF